METEVPRKKITKQTNAKKKTSTKRKTTKTKIENTIDENSESVFSYDNIEFKNEENIKDQIQQTPSKYLKVENINSFKENTSTQAIENDIDLMKQQIKELTIENNDLKIKMLKLEKRLNNIINQLQNPQQTEDLNIDTELSYRLNSD